MREAARLRGAKAKRRSQRAREALREAGGDPHWVITPRVPFCYDCVVTRENARAIVHA